MKIALHRLNGVKTVIELGVEHYTRVAYIKAMINNWITLGTIGQVHYVTYQLVSCLLMQTYLGSLLGLNS